MDARRRGHVLAHIVHADIHELDGVERASSEMRRAGGMRGTPKEGKIDIDAGEREWPVDAGEGGRVPTDRDVHIVEGAGAHHEAFARAAFLRRTAIVTHAPLEARGGKPILDG